MCLDDDDAIRLGFYRRPSRHRSIRRMPKSLRVSFCFLLEPDDNSAGFEEYQRAIEDRSHEVIRAYTPILPLRRTALATGFSLARGLLRNAITTDIVWKVQRVVILRGAQNTSVATPTHPLRSVILRSPSDLRRCFPSGLTNILSLIFPYSYTFV